MSSKIYLDGRSGLQRRTAALVASVSMMALLATQVSAVENYAISNPRETGTAAPANAPAQETTPTTTAASFGGAMTTQDSAPSRQSTGGSPARKSSASSNASSADGKAVQEQAKVIKQATVSKPIFTLSGGYESVYMYHGLDVIGASSNPTNALNAAGATTAGVFVPISTLQRFLGAAVDGRLTSPIGFASGSVEWKGFLFSAGFSQAADGTVPYKSTLDLLQKNLTTGDLFFPLRAGVLPGRLPQVKYSEFNFNLNYTYALAKGLNLTVGYDSFVIPEHSFRNTNYIGELFGRIVYSPWKFLDISGTYYRYFSDGRVPQMQSSILDVNFVTNVGGTYGNGTALNKNPGLVNGPEYLNGGYAEIRVDGKFDLYRSGSFGLRFLPYATVSYNNGYFSRLGTASSVASGPYTSLVGVPSRFVANNGVAYNGFNTIEIGARLVASFGGFSVAPAVNYGFGLNGNDVGANASNSFNTSGRTGNPQYLWAGVTASCRF